MVVNDWIIGMDRWVVRGNTAFQQGQANERGRPDAPTGAGARRGPVWPDAVLVLLGPKKGNPSIDGLLDFRVALLCGQGRTAR